MTIAWDDEGVVLAARPHGESGLILSALTFAHGRHAGWVAAGSSRAKRPLFQPGNRLALNWQARLADDLGRFAAEPVELVASRLLDAAPRLQAASAVCAVLETALPERVPQPALYPPFVALLRTLATGAAWYGPFLAFERFLLEETGFAMDLERCAVTGSIDDLAFVSPRTGRAVARGAAPTFEARLLPLPDCFQAGGEPSAAAFVAGLRLTGHFLERHVYHAVDRPLPAARLRLLQLAEEALNRGVDP
ncbi:MAG: DNA repair protein RecO [Pseudomonadota bacterium]